LDTAVRGDNAAQVRERRAVRFVADGPLLVERTHVHRARRVGGMDGRRANREKNDE
jgi:hypothetical protein